MDTNYGQAYGLGRASGHVDIQQFFQAPYVLNRILCLAFSFIIYMCISATTQWVDQFDKEVCLYDIDSSSTCYFGMQIALLGIIEGFALIGLEYMMWKSSSIKLRRRAVRASIGISASESVLCVFMFMYIVVCYVKTKSVEGTSASNPTFGLLFLFFAVFAWAYLAFQEYKRLLKGVDPEFAGSTMGEDAAHFTSYNAEENPADQISGLPR